MGRKKSKLSFGEQVHFQREEKKGNEKNEETWKNYKSMGSFWIDESGKSQEIDNKEKEREKKKEGERERETKHQTDGQTE